MPHVKHWDCHRLIRVDIKINYFFAEIANNLGLYTVLV